MIGSRRLIRDNATLSSCIDQLQARDIVCCRLRLKAQEEHILLDLVERDIEVIPSATSQLASRSKAFQTRIFSSFMIPGTAVMYSVHDILEAISLYRKMKIQHVILKQDRKNGGLGIHFFKDIEDIFTIAANNVLSFPFILQPFIAAHHDIRVIILGDYIESYQRVNPGNLRSNLHCGGRVASWVLSEEQLDLCRRVMRRGRFPYAHIDLMHIDNETTYLAEINLRGGIRGATITPGEYRQKIEELHQTLLETILHP